MSVLHPRPAGRGPAHPTAAGLSAGPSVAARVVVLTLAALLGMSLLPGSTALASTPLPVQQVEAPPTEQPAAEITELRTATTKVFGTDEPGVLRARTYSGSVHFQDAAGLWQDIDPILIPADVPGVYESAANSTLVQVAGDASSPALGRVELDADHSVEFGLQGAAPVLTEPVGDQISYADVLPGSTVRLTSTRTGLKEELLLDSPAAGSVFLFPMRLQGLTARLGKTGGIEYLDAAGTVRMTTPAGWMVDSSTGPDGASPEPHFGVNYSLANLPGGITLLTMTLDQGWLKEPSREFPVTVDPSFMTTVSKQDDTYVATNTPADRSSLPDLRIGHTDPDRPGRTRRTYMHFRHPREHSGAAGEHAPAGHPGSIVHPDPDGPAPGDSVLDRLEPRHAGPGDSGGVRLYTDRVELPRRQRGGLPGIHHPRGHGVGFRDDGLVTEPRVK